MTLSSPRFAPILQCQQAALSAPLMKTGAKGPGVGAVQQGLIDLGFAMPLSTRRFGVPDGVFGSETTQRLIQFQKQKGLMADGVIGKDTMHRLDALLPGPTSSDSALPFTVPGLKSVIAQPTSMKQQSLAIRPAAAAVAEKYGVMVDQNQGLPPAEFGPFLDAADMVHEPMINLTIEGWLRLLRNKGLLWVGTLNSIGPGAGLHSRIIEAMSGDGSVDGTMMHIIDPAGGKRYQETFRDFLTKYEGAFGQVSTDYFQIRHF
jgi:hypothetical protein